MVGTFSTHRIRRRTRRLAGLLSLAFMCAAGAAAQDVGVIKGLTGCPPGAQEIRIHMDNEDTRQASRLSGWVGATRLDRAGNIDYHFCRVPGSGFVGAPGTFAVLQLAPTCPAGALSVWRYFDNENSSPSNSVHPSVDSIAPSWVGNDSRLQFCLFQGGGSGRFPYLGRSYGVFASSAALPAPHATAWGYIHSDDQDNSNHNYYYVEDWVQYSLDSPFPQVFYDRHNTRLYTALAYAPSPAPTARCSVTPPAGVGYVYAQFEDGGSYASSGRWIDRYEWTFADGTTESHAGPIWRDVWASEVDDAVSFFGRLTVTDNVGDSSSATCWVYAYRCEEAMYGNPCP